MFSPFVIIFLKELFDEIILLIEIENKDACNICFDVRIPRKKKSINKILQKDDNK